VALGLATRRRKARFGAPSASSSSVLLAAVERRAGITSAGLVLLAFAVVGFVLGRLVASAAVLMLVYGSLVMLGVAYAAGRRKLAVVARRSELPTRVREGQVVPVTLELTAKRRVSTVVLEETLHPQLGSSVRLPVPLLPGGQAVTHDYAFTPSLRGIYPVGPLEAVWSDPFGLTRHRMVLGEPETVIVHPRIEKVDDRIISREWEDPPIRPPVSRPWPTGFEFYGMRDYVAGDDPRRIVWRAVAQYDRYLVRESEQGITDKVVVVLDTDLDHHSPGDPSETFETAVRVAASISAKHLKDGFSVSIESNDSTMVRDLRGPRAEIAMLDLLAAVQRQKAGLTQSVDRILTGRRGNAHHLVITPHLSQSMAARLRLLLERGTSLMVVIVLWEDSDPMSLHRAGSLGCNVVEVNASSSLDLAFRHVVRRAGR
jgi:uncharacterized protein (DUF58 family)